MQQTQPVQVPSPPQGSGSQLNANNSLKKQVLAKPAGKKRNVKVKLGQPINLLSDTGLLLRNMRWRSRVYRISVSVLSVTVLITLAGFGFWFYQERRERAIDTQINVTEQQLAALGEVNNLAHVYDQRLKNIEKLWEDSAAVPALILEDLSTLAGNSETELISLNMSDRTLTMQFLTSDTSELYHLLEMIETNEVEGKWENTKVTRSEYREEKEIVLTVNTVVKKINEKTS